MGSQSKSKTLRDISDPVEALLELGTIVYDGDSNLTLPEESVKVNLNDAPVLKRINRV